MKLQKKIDYSGGSNPIYVGESVPGSSPASAKWRIYKITYSSTNPEITSWADGSKDFIKVWTSRTTYTYITT